MKKIVIAMIEAGGGHKSPAFAVAESLREVSDSEVQIEVMDFCREVGAEKIDRMHKEGWERALARPKYVRFMYGVADFFGPFTRAVISVLFLGFFKKARIWLDENPPDLFFSTHFLTGAAAVYAKKRTAGLSFPIIMYGTEPNDISSLWLWKGIDRLIVSSDKAAAKAVRKGMREEQVMVAGYPVRPSFFTNLRDRDTVRRELNIEPDKTTLLLSAGAQGVQRMAGYVDILIERDVPVNCIIVCGRNEHLFYELSGKGKDAAGNRHIKIMPLGYVSNMNELLSISDLACLKAGPASTYEALFFGIPVVFFHFVENEKANIDFVLENGIGWYAPAPEDLAALLEEVLASGGAEIEARKRRIEGLGLHNGAPEIANYLADYHLN
jgi:UDP-N-acetylglucosamine:LPS N-acetylglucosamine transferase